MKRQRHQIDEMAPCGGGRRPRRRLVGTSTGKRVTTSSITRTLLLVTLGGGGGGGGGLSLPAALEACHAFTTSTTTVASSTRTAPATTTARSTRYRPSAATLHRMNLATLSTDEGHGETNAPNDRRSTGTKGSSGGETAKAKARGRTNGKRRPSPNKRTSLKWVVESVETCLCKEKGYASEYGRNVEEGGGPRDWQEQDLQLVDALWELCWGELR